MSSFQQEVQKVMDCYLFLSSITSSQIESKYLITLFNASWSQVVSNAVDSDLT